MLDILLIAIGVIIPLLALGFLVVLGVKLFNKYHKPKGRR